MVIIASFYVYQREFADAASVSFVTYVPILLLSLLGVSTIFNTIYAAVHFNVIMKEKKKEEQAREQVHREYVANVAISIQLGREQTIDEIKEGASDNMSNLIQEITNISVEVGNKQEQPTTMPKKDQEPIILNETPNKASQLEVNISPIAIVNETVT